jgi:hypothetical protein
MWAANCKATIKELIQKLVAVRGTRAVECCTGFAWRIRTQEIDFSINIFIII